MSFEGWKIFALGSAFFAALTAILGKLGVQSINSNLATLFRTVIILLFLSGIVTWRNEWRLVESIDGRSMLFLTLSGLATGASWLCYYRALQLGPASKVAPVDKLSVALAVLMAVLILGERIDLKTLVGCALVVLGSLILVF